MTNPKPLDLEELRKNVRKIFEDKDKFRYLGNNVRRRIDHEYGFLHALSIIEERIKEACEFYLRYKDNPELLLEEKKSAWIEVELSKFREFYAESKIKNVRLVSWDLEKYNKWLFKLAFKGVLE